MSENEPKRGDGYIGDGPGYLHPETARVLGEQLGINPKELTPEQLEELGAAAVEAANQMREYLDLL